MSMGFVKKHIVDWFEAKGLPAPTFRRDEPGHVRDNQPHMHVEWQGHTLSLPVADHLAVPNAQMSAAELSDAMSAREAHLKELTPKLEEFVDETLEAHDAAIAAQTANLERLRQAATR